MGADLSVPVVDLRGKVAIVTGGNTGIGYEIVKGLAEMGVYTIMACRSEERALRAISCLKEAVGPEKELNVEFLPLDLASFQSTKEFVRLFREKNLPLHILINNAGVVWVPYSKTEDGFEMHYQVNHLSPLLLTLELVPNIIETAASTGDGRILFVSSGFHAVGAAFNPDNLNSEIQFDRMKVYSHTKLYNVMTTHALQLRLQNVNVTVSAQHPGFVKTEISKSFEDKRLLALTIKIGHAIFARTPKDGAATTLNCAVNPELNSQQAFYYSSCKQTNSSLDSTNEQYQEELWKCSMVALKDHLSPEVLEKYGPPLPAGEVEEIKQETISNDDPEKHVEPVEEKEGEGVTTVNEGPTQAEVKPTELKVEVHADTGAGPH